VHCNIVKRQPNGARFTFYRALKDCRDNPPPERKKPGGRSIRLDVGALPIWEGDRHVENIRNVRTRRRADIRVS